MIKTLLASGLLLILPLLAEDTSEEIFTHIYSTNHWANPDSVSGPGSLPENARPYMRFVQEFIKEHQIKSVVDIGCGDWAFSRHLDWSGVDYIGVDVVKELVTENSLTYGSKNITFLHADLTKDELPEADLLICKDVLQHLPNADIAVFLKQLPKFKHCLITNDVDPYTGKAYNSDSERGGYHYIDLTQPPFLLLGEKVLTYQASWWLKQVLHIENKRN